MVIKQNQIKISFYDNYNFLNILSKSLYSALLSNIPKIVICLESGMKTAYINLEYFPSIDNLTLNKNLYP